MGATGYSFRSDFEQAIGSQLLENSADWSYETLTVPFVIPETSHKYTADFLCTKRDGTMMLIETKGIFKLADRKKHLYLRACWPDLDIRLLFMDANKKLQKGAKSTYGEWATKNGFKWAHKRIPKEWLKELAYL